MYCSNRWKIFNLNNNILVKIEAVYDEIETIQLNETDPEINDMTRAVSRNQNSTQNSNGPNLHRKF